MDSYMLKNGYCYSNTGERRVAFSMPVAVIAPVCRVEDRGYTPDRGTYQWVTEGDLVISCVWGHGQSGGDWGYQINGESLGWDWQAKHCGLLAGLDIRYPWLDGFLSPHGRGSSHLPCSALPKGRGWLMTREDLAKYARLGFPVGTPEVLYPSDLDGSCAYSLADGDVVVSDLTPAAALKAMGIVSVDHE